ncbi:hypothetical protein JCM5350_007969 [Sporobolomyces pararoseus]
MESPANPGNKQLSDEEQRLKIKSFRADNGGEDARFDETSFPLLTSTSTSPHSPSSVIDISTPPEVAPPLPAPAPAPLLPSTPAAGAAPSPPAPNPARIASLPPFTPPPQPVFARETAPSPSTPDQKPPLSPIPESPDPLNFLPDPFAALLASADKQLNASQGESLLPSSYPQNHREEMSDSANENWRLGEKEDFNSLNEKYKVFNVVDKSPVP